MLVASPSEDLGVHRDVVLGRKPNGSCDFKSLRQTDVRCVEVSGPDVVLRESEEIEKKHEQRSVFPSRGVGALGPHMERLIVEQFISDRNPKNTKSRYLIRRNLGFSQEACRGSIFVECRSWT